MSKTESRRTRIKRLRPGDETYAFSVSHLFGEPADESRAQKRLEQSNHYLLIAYEDEVPAGVATYTAAGGRRESSGRVMLSWQFDPAQER